MTRLAAVVVFMIASCSADVESGLGQGPTGDGSGMTASGATSMETQTADDGVDDTSDVESPSPPPAQSYFIAESMDFSGNGCEESNVNEVTESLRNELDDDGWVGTRVTEELARPADFIDDTTKSFGRDHITSDAASFAVYAGHGGIDQMKWGTRDDTPGVWSNRRCSIIPSRDLRLGSLSGGWAKAVALLTSCNGRLACYESSLSHSDATQLFAFNNSPIIWGNAARRFYRGSEPLTNRIAWIAAMEDRPGFSRNSPVVYTRGTSEEQVLQIHDTARLSSIDETPSSAGTGWYAYTWVDRGLLEKCAISPRDDCVGVDD